MDGPVDGLAVLVHGATGGVGSIATQSARRGASKVLAVVEKVDQLARAQNLGAHHAFLADDPKLAEQLRSLAPDGVHRIADVDFAAHIDLDGDILALGGVKSRFIPRLLTGLRSLTGHWGLEKRRCACSASDRLPSWTSMLRRFEP